MISVSDFGNPESPFGTPVLMHHMPGRLVGKLITGMSMHANDVQVIPADDTQIRTISFDCTAPFRARDGVFENSDVRCQDRYRGRPTREAVSIELGDFVSAGSIVCRWARLQRKNGMPFGIPGISRLDASEKYEQWHALTTTFVTETTSARVELWGEQQSRSGGSQVEALHQRPGVNIPPHLDSIRYALDCFIRR